MIAFLDQLATIVGYAALTVSFAVALFVITAPLSPESRRCRARARALRDRSARPGLRLVEPSAQVVDLAQYRRDWRGGAA